MNDSPSAPPPEMPFEQLKWTHELKRSDAQRVHDDVAKVLFSTNDSVIKSSELVLKTCVVINGGAAVSVLTFIGSLIGKNSDFATRLIPISDCLAKFAYGVVAAVGAMSLGYFTQFMAGMYAASLLRTWEHPYVKKKRISYFWGILKFLLHWAAIIAAFASVGFFILGVLSVRNAVPHLAGP